MGVMQASFGPLALQMAKRQNSPQLLRSIKESMIDQVRLLSKIILT